MRAVAELLDATRSYTAGRGPDYNRGLRADSGGHVSEHAPNFKAPPAAEPIGTAGRGRVGEAA